MNTTYYYFTGITLIHIILISAIFALVNPMIWGVTCVTGIVLALLPDMHVDEEVKTRFTKPVLISFIVSLLGSIVLASLINAFKLEGLMSFSL